MWTSIGKLFSKRNDTLHTKSQSISIDAMFDSNDSYDTRLAKQRATIKWLLSKAYNNQVPDNLLEPFYRDHENQEFLKPQIVHSLANAEYYCSALGNIYCDPNYHNLNHATILAILSRKSVLAEDQITETILIQTNPLKIKAHMTVIESIMVLYAKEVVTSDRVLAAIERFDYANKAAELSPLPQDHVQLIFLWLNYANSALKKRLDAKNKMETGTGTVSSLNLPYVKDLKDLCDGISIAALISFYCPDALNWSDIKSSTLPTVSDSIHNLELVFRFCNEFVPFPVFHMLPEDITYMRGSLQYNLTVFLADLFNCLEINPVKCVRYPGSEKPKSVLISHQPYLRHNSIHAPTIVPIPDLRPSLNSSRQTNAFQVTKTLPVQMTIRNYSSTNKSASDITEDSLLTNNNDSFVVHKSRGISTLSSVMNATDNSLNACKRIEDVAKLVPAGKPTIRNNNVGFNTITGRTRLRRTSSSEESQLTIENFCGSQDNINVIGRNPDKEPVAVSRKISAPASVAVNNSPVRSTLQDSISSINFTDCANKETAKTSPNSRLKRHLSSEAITRSLSQDFDNVDGDSTLTNSITTSSIKSQTVDDSSISRTTNMSSSNSFSSAVTNTTSAGNTTTWQEQHSDAPVNGFLSNSSNSSLGGENVNGVGVTPQFNDIRLKLQEKRRHIQYENRRMEMLLGQQRLNLGKTAFFQAINKAKRSISESDSEALLIDIGDGDCYSNNNAYQASIKDITSSSESKNFDTGVDNYQQSIVQMNSSLDEIKADIQRLSSQQSQLTHDQILAQQMENLILQQQQQQQLISNSFNHLNQITNNYRHHQLIENNNSYGSSPQLNQFYLHGQQPTHHRKTWTESLSSNNNNNNFEINSNTNTWNNSMYNSPNSFNLNSHNGMVNGIDGHHKIYSSPNPSKLFSGQKFNTISSRSQTVSNGPNVISLQQISKPQPRLSIQSSIPTPSEDDMAPQNISFIGSAENLPKFDRKYNISFGSKTYRVEPSNRQALSPDLFQRTNSRSPISKTLATESEVLSEKSSSGNNAKTQVVSLEKSSPKIDKGFYISFEDDPPTKPKPPLRSKKSINRKEKSMSYVENGTDFLNHNNDVPNVSNISKIRSSQEIFEGLIEKENNYDIKKRTKVENVEEKPKAKIAGLSGEAMVFENKSTDTRSMDEMERKKERILMASLRRQQMIEATRERKEAEAEAKRELELKKEEEKQRRKEEQALKRAQILERHKLKKAMEEAEREGKSFDTLKTPSRLRAKNSLRQRPRTIHIDSSNLNGSLLDLNSTTSTIKKKGSTSNLSPLRYSKSTIRRDYYRGSSDSLSIDQNFSKDVYDEDYYNACDSSIKYGSYKDIQDLSDLNHNQSQLGPKYGTLSSFKGRKSNSLMNLYGSQDSNMEVGSMGKQTSRSRVASPAILRNLSSPSGPGSLPPGLISKRRNNFDDNASDISSTNSSFMDYTGPKLYKQPNQKSNRSIILNAVEYCVFPGAVNKMSRQRLIDEIARADSKHFLILFRDAGCQFRALYSYYPDTGEIIKLCGTGPKQVHDQMFDKFFKYNSGGKCFSQVHTKHLSVTIDAFTIHNSLWQGKKIALSNKKDMSLVV